MEYRISILIVLFCLALLSAVMYRVYIEGSYATQGEKLYQLQKQVQELQKDNLVLKEQIAIDESFTVIASKAGKMGFIKNDTYLYFK